MNEINEDVASLSSYIVSPSGKWMACRASSYGEENAIVWDSRTRIIRTTIMGDHTPLLFLPSPNGLEDYIVLLKDEDSPRGHRSLVVWDHFHGALVATLDGSKLDDVRVKAVGKFLLVTSDHQCTVSVWCITNFTLLHRADIGPLLSRNKYRSGFAQVSPTNERLLVHFPSSAIYEICVWDTTTWTLYAALPPDKDYDTHYRTAVAFSDGDNSIVAVCKCGVVQTFNFHTGDLRNTYLIDASGDRSIKGAEHVELSPDGRLVCWAREITGDQVVNMSDTQTGALLWSVGRRYPYLGSILSISFSPDSQYVATSYSDYALRLLRVADGKCVASEGMGGCRADVGFSRDGEVLTLSTWGGAAKGEAAVKVLRIQELLEIED